MSRLMRYAGLSGPALPTTREGLEALQRRPFTLPLFKQVGLVMKPVMIEDEEFRANAVVLVNGLQGQVAQVRMADRIQAKARDMEGFEDVVRAETHVIIAKMHKVLSVDYKGLSVRDQRRLALEARAASEAAAVDSQLAQ